LYGKKEKDSSYTGILMLIKEREKRLLSKIIVTPSHLDECEVVLAYLH
jgi:hypothetical protein